MKTGVAFVTNLIFSAAAIAANDHCHTACANVKKVATVKSACNAFRNALPRPKVARHCHQGFNAAIEENCYEACVNDGNIPTFVVEQRLDNTCEHSLKDTPRPLCHDSCVQGYRAGVEGVSSSLTKMMAQMMEMMRKGGDTSVETDDPSLLRGERQTATTKLDDIEHTEAGVSGTHREAGTAQEVRTSGNNRAELQHDFEAPGVTDEYTDRIGITNELDEIVVGVRESDDVKGTAQEIAREIAEEDAEKIHDKDGLLLTLPITVDGKEKELTILEGEEPTEAVVSFCNDNMPAEEAACIDQLLRVVDDSLVDSTVSGSVSGYQ